ncbi:hypothetical protein [Halobacterium bonnevillei]|nr:hypothetical protein [Halobacterium bonnevillei]
MRGPERAAADAVGHFPADQAARTPSDLHGGEHGTREPGATLTDS